MKLIRTVLEIFWGAALTLLLTVLTIQAWSPKAPLVLSLLLTALYVGLLSHYWTNRIELHIYRRGTK